MLTLFAKKVISSYLDGAPAIETFAEVCRIKRIE